LRDFIQGFGYEPIMSDFGDNYGSSFHTNEKNIMKYQRVLS